MLVVPFGRRRLLGVVVDVSEESELPLERLAEPIAALEADVPQSLVDARAVGGAGVRLHSGARARAGAPAGHRHRRRAAAAPEALAASRDHAGRRGGAVRRRTDGSAPARRARGARERTAGRSRTRPPHRLLARHAAQPGAARAAAARERRRCAAPPAPGAGGRAGRHRRAHGGPGGGFRADRVPARAGRGGLGERRPLLLHGVTGSGKTEVYLRSVAAALERGPLGGGARSRDSAYPADRGPLRRALRRAGGGDALAALAARALRRVVADAARRGARVRGPALGRVRAVRRPGADHRRRGARRLVQAGGRSALRRPHRRGAPRRR